jgi:methylmalonyl-CoA mutase
VFAGKCSGEFPFTAGLYFNVKEKILLECLRKVDRKELAFHYEWELPAKISTTFDSVTLYGNDPHTSWIFMEKSVMPEFLFVVWMMLKNYILVSIWYAMTSVSMTINGPAPMLLLFS